jgi:ABC-type amino acid transport substrate-binding protein
MSRLHTAAAALCLAPALALAQMAGAPFEGRLKKIHDTKTISVAYRADATPFSFDDNDKKPTGYMVELCRSVIGVIEKQVGVAPLQVKWVPVTAQTRFSAIAGGQADMECGATTVTLRRLREVDFSSFVFVESTAVLVRRQSNVRSFSELKDKKIAVVAGTSNEQALADQIQRRKFADATVVPVGTREQGIAALEAGAVDGYASDRLLLVGAEKQRPGTLALLNDELSMEPYAIVLPRGDWAFRLAVNRALAQIYRSGAQYDVFVRWFDRLGLRPSEALGTAWAFGALAE